MTLVIGIDDAGRGPLIGPMILSGVLLTSEQEAFLKKQGITDSKMISHSSRINMAKIIEEASENFKVVETTPEEIDYALTHGTNLNTLEAMKMAEAINFLNPEKETVKVIVDCPSVNTTAFKNTLLEHIKHSNNLEILCEHKADANHLSPGAASILAKVRREEAVSELKKKFGNLGSGYPSDPATKAFLKEKGKELADAGIFRKTWATYKKEFPGEGQSTLGGF